MSRLAREGTAEPVSRDQILRRERGQGIIHFPCSADHEQDCQPYPVDPCPCYNMLWPYILPSNLYSTCTEPTVDIPDVLPHAIRRPARDTYTGVKSPKENDRVTTQRARHKKQKCRPVHQHGPTFVPLPFSAPTMGPQGTYMQCVCAL